MHATLQVQRALVLNRLNHIECPQAPGERRGRANEESDFGDVPTLRFKTDKAYATPGEMAARAARAAELQACRSFARCVSSFVMV